MGKPRFGEFGRQFRHFVSEHASLGDGLYRWFRDEVEREDRYLRRWMRGENLPSEDNWRRNGGNTCGDRFSCLRVQT